MLAKEERAVSTWIIAVLCLINFANIFDRSIIPGAPAQFQYFIQTATNSSDMGTLMGLLSSSFITSYSISMPIFGYLALYMKPFRLISFGLGVWCVAVFMCSLSKRANSFELLLAGRILSGVGEASFQCIAPPFIHEHAPSNSQTLWLGIFTMSAMIGSLCGGVAASVMSTTEYGWSSVFALEGIAMVPLVSVCLFGIPAIYNSAARQDQAGESQGLLDSPQEASPSFLNELKAVCSDSIFIWLSLGGAAVTFASAGLNMFTTLLMMGLGVFADETDANVTLGIQGIVAGLAGMILGSLLLDQTSHGALHMRQFYALRQLLVGLVISIAALCLALIALPSRGWFLAWLAVVIVVSGTISPAMLTALFHGVKPSCRGLMTGINSVVVHLLGDVPAPIVIGWIKDREAPHCNSVVIDGIVRLNPACRDDKDGLVMAMSTPMFGFAITIICFAIALYISWRRTKKQQLVVAL
ncbi:unnamed protein product [Aphanomyces euteiches]|nr:hypothetical protein AeRB84_004762 [Aphanomyces euteiches]